ncbi:hypothetical protein D3C87_1772910 [compost metagenome]
MVDHHHNQLRLHSWNKDRLPHHIEFEETPSQFIPGKIVAIPWVSTVPLNFQRLQCVLAQGRERKLVVGIEIVVDDSLLRQQIVAVVVRGKTFSQKDIQALGNIFLTDEIIDIPEFTQSGLVVEHPCP